MTANPLVVGRVEMSTPLAGTFLLEDCESIANGIRHGDWVEGGMGAFAAVADGIATVVDPLGSAIGAGIGWLLEHMEPLKGWFNDLTGDSGEVMGFAGTWENIATQMQAASDELTRVLGDLDSQRGQMIATYRRFQGECAAHAAAAGTLSGAIGTGMQIASVIVQAVHDITRDALSQLIGTAISAVATAACTLGFGTPWAVAQVASRAASLASKVGKFITKLVKAITKLMPLLDDAARLFRSLQGALDKALAGAADAVRSLGRGADDVADALPSHADVPSTHADGTAPHATHPSDQLDSAAHDAPHVADTSLPTFTNAEGAEYGQRVWGDTLDSLSAEQRASIRDYTQELGGTRPDGAIDYTDINAALRTGEGLDNPSISSAITNIQGALETTPTPRDLTVLRGMNLQNQSWTSFSSVDELPGTSLSNPSFVSTTLGDSLPPFADSMDSVLRVEVPAGTPAMYIDSISAIPGEGELLLGKGLDMEIVSAVADPSGRWLIHARIVTP